MVEGAKMDSLSLLVDGHEQLVTASGTKFYQKLRPKYE